MAKNIIFLDIDGVLNNEATFAMTPDQHMEFACVKFLQDAVSQIPDCKIVVTSSWRNPDNNLQTFLDFVAYKNCAEIFEPLKPFLHEDFAVKWLPGPQRRPDEIAEWLSRHPEVEKYICLDDGSGYLPDQPFLRIDRLHGFWADDKLILLDYFGWESGLSRYPAIINRLSRKVLLQRKIFIKKFLSR